MNGRIAQPAIISRRPVGLWLLVALLALVASSKAVLYDTLDPDCFWHLRVAAQLERDGVGPLVDEISFMSQREPWTPYSWLAELGMKTLWDSFGWRAAVLAHAVMAGAVIALVAMACREVAPESSWSIVTATVVAGYWSMPYLSFRPVTAAIVLIAACAWLLRRDRRLGERSRAVWLVIPLAAVCANLHFYALLIPAMVAALWAGAAWERSSESVDPSAARRRLGRYVVLLPLTCLASLATPMLPGVIRSIAYYQFRDPTLSASFIAEFQPFYAGPLGAVSVGLLLLTLGCALAKLRQIRVGERLWLLIGVVLLLRLGRFAPVFAILAAPVLAATLPMLRSAALERPVVRAALAVVLIGGFVRLFVAFPTAVTPLSAWLNRHGRDAPGYPCAAADFVRRNVTPRSGRLLNEFNWGGYLAWRMGDSFQVFIDGRTQLYAPDLWERIYGRAAIDAGPALTSNADAAVLPAGHSRLRDTLMANGWTRAYRDDRAEVLLPPPPGATADVRD